MTKVERIRAWEEMARGFATWSYEQSPYGVYSEGICCALEYRYPLEEQEALFKDLKLLRIRFSRHWVRPNYETPGNAGLRAMWCQQIAEYLKTDGVD